jgi:hypothetical protein
VCVRERERERHRDRDREREREVSHFTSQGSRERRRERDHVPLVMKVSLLKLTNFVLNSQHDLEQPTQEKRRGEREEGKRGGSERRSNKEEEPEALTLSQRILFVEF